ncbi:hypothetical protein [Mesorhizobium sp. M0500]|uniref:hypothetical protein n=1 Tax=Mesorhizobium sp. M0500 TaxID=2956953 RepID=UPI003336F170
MGEFEFLFKRSIGDDGPRVIAQEAMRYSRREERSRLYQASLFFLEVSVKDSRIPETVLAAMSEGIHIIRAYCEYLRYSIEDLAVACGRSAGMDADGPLRFRPRDVVGSSRSRMRAGSTADAMYEAVRSSRVRYRRHGDRNLGQATRL